MLTSESKTDAIDGIGPAYPACSGFCWAWSLDGKRQRAHYDGPPVEFIAAAISTLGRQVVDRFDTPASTGCCSGTTGVTAEQDWCFRWRWGVAGVSVNC
jgi:hypothetical protein